MNKVFVVNGESRNRTVILRTTSHAASARYVGSGNVVVEVRPERADIAQDYFTTFVLTAVARCVALAACAQGITMMVPVTGRWYGCIHLPLIPRIISFIEIRDIRTWHGAEHMAVAASDRSTTLPSVRDIGRHSRIDDRCGGRIISSWILLYGGFLWVSTHVQIGWPVRTVLSYGLGLIATIVFDRTIGLHTMPLFRQASRLMQRFLTTSVPTRKELVTAHAALEGLHHAARNDVGKGVTMTRRYGGCEHGL